MQRPKKQQQHRTEWLVNKLFTNRGWVLCTQNGKHVLRKRF